jgi:hypothetical protein
MGFEVAFENHSIRLTPGWTQQLIRQVTPVQTVDHMAKTDTN